MTDVLRLSLSQMMKLVAYCAVVSACFAPMANFWRAGAVDVLTVVIFEAVAVPLAMAGTSFVLVAPGGRRDDLILRLLLASAAAAAAFASWSFVAFTVPGMLGAWGHPSTVRVALAEAMFHLLIALVLIAAVAFLAVRLITGDSIGRMAPRRWIAARPPDPPEWASARFSEWWRDRVGDAMNDADQAAASLGLGLRSIGPDEAMDELARLQAALGVLRSLLPIPSAAGIPALADTPDRDRAFADEGPSPRPEGARVP
jgi:hypothetical protein